MADLNSLANEAEAILAQIVASAGTAGEQQPQSVKQAAADIKAIREAAERQQKAAPQDPELWKAIQVAAKTNPSIAAQIGAMTATAGENSEEGKKRRARYRERRDEEKRKTRRASLFNRFRRVVDAEIVKPPPMTAGQLRRSAYRGAKQRQQRVARRQRLIDRMANRTLGGRAGTIAQSLGSITRNPASAAQQLPRAMQALGMGGTTAATVSAAAGPVGLAVLAATLAQRAAMSTQRFAVDASSPFMGKAEHGVAGGMAESATKAAVYGPLGMLKELATLPKNIADWDEALLQSKRGLAQFSGALNRYFAEAERREIVRGVESAQATGGSLSTLGEKWQDLQDELRPLKDTITTHLAALLTVGTAILRSLNIVIQWSPAFIAMKKAADAYEAANRKEAATPFNTMMNEFRKAGATSTRAPRR